MSRLEAVGRGKLKIRYLEARILGDWFSDIFGFLFFGPNWEVGQILEELSVSTDCFCGLASWIACCRLWIRILFLYMVWPCCICLVSLSKLKLNYIKLLEVPHVGAKLDSISPMNSSLSTMVRK